MKDKFEEISAKEDIKPVCPRSSPVANDRKSSNTIN